MLRFAAANADAQNYLFPNGTGQIAFQLQVDPTSAEDATGVSVTVDTGAAAPPSFLQLDATGSPPDTIAVGGSGSYIFNYQVSQAPQSGAVSFGLDVNMTPNDAEQPLSPVNITAFVDVNPPKITSIQSGQGK